MDKCTIGPGQKISLLSASFANAIAENLNDAEIEFIAAFLVAVGDTLMAITATNNLCNERKSNKDIPQAN
ncbi:MAG: hypothetical protein ACI4I6_09755 [Hominimerdicola sp.]